MARPELNAQQLLGKRILVRSQSRGLRNEVQEVKVLELSPTQKWVRLMNHDSIQRPCGCVPHDVQDVHTRRINRRHIIC